MPSSSESLSCRVDIVCPQCGKVDTFIQTFSRNSPDYTLSWRLLNRILSSQAVHPLRGEFLKTLLSLNCAELSMKVVSERFCQHSTQPQSSTTGLTDPSSSLIS